MSGPGVVHERYVVHLQLLHLSAYAERDIYQEMVGDTYAE